GCKSGIRPDLLEIPSGTLKETLPESAKTDYSHIIKDYANVDIGDPVGDGSKVDKPTDAARLQNALNADKAKIFIQLNDDLNDTEHVYKSLRAAAERANKNGAAKNSLRYLDIKELNQVASQFNFDEKQLDEFYLSMANKINAEVSKDTTLLIKIDDLHHTLSS